MPHHRYISFIAIAGFFSLLGLLLIIYRLTPYEMAGLSLAFFFLTLFMFLASFFAVTGFYFRVWLFKNDIFYKQVNLSLRQGVLLSLLSVFALIFQMLKVLGWFSGLLLVVIIVLLEFYFSLKDAEEV